MNGFLDNPASARKEADTMGFDRVCEIAFAVLKTRLSPQTLEKIMALPISERRRGRISFRYLKEKAPPYFGFELVTNTEERRRLSEATGLKEVEIGILAHFLFYYDLLPLTKIFSGVLTEKGKNQLLAPPIGGRRRRGLSL